MTDTFHRVPAASFDALASGLGDPATIRLLAAGQLSKRLLLLRLLLDEAGGSGSRSGLNEYAELLDEAQRRDPAAAAGVLIQPHLGSWAAVTLRALRSGAGSPDLGRLGAIAAAAAARAGLTFALKLPVRGGGVVLPTYGRAGTTDQTVDVSAGADGLRVGVVRVPDDPAADAPGWQGLRVLSASAGGLDIRLALDDLDPFRDCHRLSAAERLPATVVDGWARLLDDAWPVLVEHHRGYAEAIAVGLTTLVPLRAPRSHLGMNVTSMDAFGAVSLTPPADPLALATALLHEFQHGKLGALMDVVPLYRRGSDRYYAPWRDDPRPLGGLLHGVYAFLGVTDFWRVQRRVLAGGQAVLAELEFARWRDRVWRTQQTLAESDSFTEAGRRFLDGMRAAQEAWQDEPVPEETLTMAREAAEDHWIGWRLRNLRPDPERVRELAAAWAAGTGRPAGAVEVPSTLAASDRMALVHNVRADLGRLRATDPRRFDELSADPGALARELPDASPGDVAYVAGDLPGAIAAYRAQIAATPIAAPQTAGHAPWADRAGDFIVPGADLSPDPRRPWVGLALACQRMSEYCPTALIRTPELVYAVHRELSAGSGGSAPDPVELARWLHA